MAQPRKWITAGMSSLAQLAHDQHVTPAEIVATTARQGPLDAAVASYVNGVFAGTIPASQVIPKGVALYLPG